MSSDKTKRYIPSMGIAFNEEKEMLKLSKMAKEGWIFESYSKLGYNFRQDEPRDLIYCLDACKLDPSEREQYFKIFEEAGWRHVCSAENYYHYFCAAPGTPPIYTDNASLLEKYSRMKKLINNAVLISGAVWILSFIPYLLLNLIWGSNASEPGVIVAQTVFFTISMLGLLFAIVMAITLIALIVRIKKIKSSPKIFG